MKIGLLPALKRYVRKNEFRWYQMQVQAETKLTLPACIKRCSELKDISEGKNLHAYLIRCGRDRERFIGNLLVEMYGKCGCLDDASAAFNKIYEPNVVSWTMLIVAYMQNGYPREGLRLFKRMQVEGTLPDKFILSIVITACATLGDFVEGKYIHSQVGPGSCESDVVVETALIHMYGKCGRLDAAREVFDAMPLKNAVSWTAAITAYTQQGHPEEALLLFKRMEMEKWVRPDKVTLVSVLDACGGLKNLSRGREIHARMVAEKLSIERDDYLGSALVDMYSKCESLGEARCVFDSLKQRNVVTCTAMISGYARAGLAEEAISLLLEMDIEGVSPNELTIVSILGTACSSKLQKVLKVAQFLVAECCSDANVTVSNATIDALGKCGKLANARKVFDEMGGKRNWVSWTCMVAAYALNGYGKEAMCLFHEMSVEGVSKNYITFITILSACTHAGLVDEGVDYFNSMIAEQCTLVTTEHYNCVVNLLGKVGRLEEAENVIYEMIVPPDAIVWRTLLSACQIHGDSARAERAASQVLRTGNIQERYSRIKEYSDMDLVRH